MKMITDLYNPSGEIRLIFFNPLGMTSEYWLRDLQIQDHLNQFELVFTDYPGYRKSAHMSCESFEELASYFYQEYAQLPPKESICIGASYGGNLASKFTQLYASSKKIILIGSIPYSDSFDCTFYDILKETLNQNKLFDFSKYLTDFSYTEKEREENPFLTLMFFSYLKNNGLNKTLLQQIQHLERNKKHKVQGVEPLILVGTKDPLIRSDYRDKCSHVYENYTLHSYENHGHFTLNNNHKAIAQIVKYIN